jgi:type IV secretory pathway VirB2 component (pilin)
MKGTKSWWLKWAPRLGYGVSLLTIALPARAIAAVADSGALTWDVSLDTFQTHLQGTVAHAVMAAAIIGTGITWAVTEDGTVRKISALAFGGAAAVASMTLMTALFPAAGALF